MVLVRGLSSLWISFIGGSQGYNRCSINYSLTQKRYSYSLESLPAKVLSSVMVDATVFEREEGIGAACRYASTVATHGYLMQWTVCSYAGTESGAAPSLTCSPKGHGALCQVVSVTEGFRQ